LVLTASQYASGDDDYTQQFEFGLDLILDGLERRLSG
jgi:hypothetical protein